MIKYVLPTLAVGILAGYLNNQFGAALFNLFFSEYVFNFSLFTLLFLMGVLFAMDEKALAKVKAAGFKMFVFPFAVALGSLMGGFVGGVVLQIDVFASMSVCAGYGWYTLAGPLAGQLFGLKWGALGLAVNLLRELVTIATTWIVAKLDRYAPIAMGGATAMDTTLPMIVRYCGQDTLIISFFSGFVLTLAAPFTITAIAALTTNSP
ncbi:MAG: lysine exporter LysO family protein [Candidatus Bathyarchaeia archaeon]